MANIRKDLHTKLYRQLMDHSRIDPASGCYVWEGYTLPNGYAQMWLPMLEGKRRKEYIHRVAWTTFAGPIPEGCEIDHVAERGCISKACWSIAHLEPVTHPVNCQRRGHPCGPTCYIHGSK